MEANVSAHECGSYGFLPPGLRSMGCRCGGGSSGEVTALLYRRWINCDWVTSDARLCQ